jgi:hypothetical protein
MEHDSDTINGLLDGLSTEGKACLLVHLVKRVFQETEEAVDLGIAPEDLWEQAFQLSVATEKYVNVLSGKCPTCEPDGGDSDD